MKTVFSLGIPFMPSLSKCKHTLPSSALPDRTFAFSHVKLSCTNPEPQAHALPFGMHLWTSFGTAALLPLGLAHPHKMRTCTTPSCSSRLAGDSQEAVLRNLEEYRKMEGCSTAVQSCPKHAHVTPEHSNAESIPLPGTLLPTQALVEWLVPKHGTEKQMPTYVYQRSLGWEWSPRVKCPWYQWASYQPRRCLNDSLEREKTTVNYDNVTKVKPSFSLLLNPKTLSLHLTTNFKNGKLQANICNCLLCRNRVTID